ncbi:MAG: aldehyde ferredoxin oxidoreductase [Ardenticatenaceae bacterium]|nr:aldehyde ferredoxin oxidoreductase [Ardenticatenaceae bacterium]
MQGWAGKILDINLTDGSINTMPLDMEMARLFLGGRGLGARLLWDLVGPEVKPLSPENALIFTTGPITASASQTSNRFNVSTKSPLTDTILHANSGGWWGMQFKRTGYDALIIRGKAASPVMIEITSDGAEIKDAGHLWGKTVFETTETLSQNRNKRNVLCIGPAGENLVRMSAIMNDKERALARGGGGAVMGSKNLRRRLSSKAVRKNKPADPDQFKFLSYETGKLLKASPLTSQALPEFGTAVVMNVVNEIGALPTRNFQQSQFEGADDISGEAITDNILVKKQACWACPIACTRITKTTSGKEGEGPEFESSWALVRSLSIDDLDRLPECSRNDMGLDTISMGNTVGCAMELAEKGFIDGGWPLVKTMQDSRSDPRYRYRRDMSNELAEGGYRLQRFVLRLQDCRQASSWKLPTYDPHAEWGRGLVFCHQ